MATPQSQRTARLPHNPSKPIVILHANDVRCGVSETHDASGNATSIGYAGVAALLKQAEANGHAAAVRRQDSHRSNERHPHLQLGR
ncbi:MAG: hypothetical protein RR747_10460, partial [Gordonibacter sp.]